MKKAIIIIVSVLVILAGAFAALWFFTDIFSFLRPARDNFSIQLGKILGSENKMSYSEYTDKINQLNYSGSYEINMDVKAKVNLPNEYIDYQTQKNLNSATLNLKTNYNDSSSTGVTKYTLFNDQSKLGLESVMNGNTLSIKCDDIYGKYLSYDMDKYEEFCQKTGTTPDEGMQSYSNLLKLMNNKDYTNFAYNMYYISEKDYKHIQNNYGDILKKVIDKDCYTMDRNQYIDIDDEEVKVTAYALTLTGEDMNEAMTTLIEKMKKDDTVKRLIIEKYNIEKNYIEAYSKLDNNSEDIEELPDLDEKSLDELFDELLENLEEEKDGVSESEKALRITIFSDKKNNPVRLQIESLDDKDDDEGLPLFTEDLAKNKNTYTLYLNNINKVLDTTDSRNNNSFGSISELKITDEYEQSTSKGETKRNGTATISVKVSGLNKYTDLFEIEYQSEKSKSQESLNLSMTSPQLKGLSIDINSTINDLDKDEQNFDFTLSGQYAIYGVQLSCNGTINKSADIDSANPVTSANSVDVYSLSKEDYDKLSNDIKTNAANSLPAKLKTFGIDVTKEQILNESTPAEPSVNPSIDSLNIPTEPVLENEENVA